MMDRRAVLIGLALTSAACIRRKPLLRSDLISAAADDAERPVLLRVSGDGEIVFSTSLSDRGHDAVRSPNKSVVTVFGRRPRRVIDQYRYRDGKHLRSTETPSNRHLYGHGLYSRDGRWLFTSENDLDYGQGVIVVRDARTLTVEHEFSSHGIGPHEMRWADNGQTLIVANGGIATHPDYGREPLNIDTMEPSLVKIDVKTGALMDRRVPAMPQSSVRHIDVLNNGETLVGLQHQDKSYGSSPLVVSADWRSTTDDDRLAPLSANVADVQALNNYTASVCCDPETGVAVVTSPRGHRVSFWDTSSRRHLRSYRLSDVAGVGFDRRAREFVISSGRGMLYRFAIPGIENGEMRKTRIESFRFDNHLTVIDT
ncbi:MAG: DUF1513 domain-containing protein [Pseudomonadota bacterium]